MRRACAALLLLGCHSIQAFEAPPPPGADARAAIVAFEGDELVVYALDLEGADPLTRPFAAEAGAAITLLYLSDDLASIQLAAGRIEPVEGPPERSLPPFLAGFQTTREGDVVRWAPIDRLPDRLAEFRLPGFTVEECAEAGGCYLDEERARQEDCSVPCPIAAPRLPEPAVPPRLPAFEPCPEGWGARQLESLVTCEPNGLDRICPSGTYAENLPEPVVFVDPGVMTLEDAIASAPDGATIALAKGVHLASVRIDRELAIAGACAAETIVDVPAGAIGVTGAADFELRGVTLRGGLEAIRIESGAATIEDAVLRETTGPAISASGGSASLARVLVEGSELGLSVDGASLAARDLIVRDTSERGLGIARSNVELERVLLERTAGFAIAIASSTVTASDLAIHTVRPLEPQSDFGIGVRALDSKITLSRASLFDLVRAGILMLGSSTFTAEDVSIDGVRPPDGGGAVVGLELAQSTESEIHRFSAAEVDGEGFLATGDAGATLEDVIIERDGATPDPLGTQCGFDVSGKANVTAHRVHLERLLRQGLCVYVEGTASITDVTAIDVGDHGLYVFQDGALTVERALIDGAADGVVAFLRTTLEVTDLTVRRMHGDVRYVLPTMLGYPRGRGIYNNALATVRVERFDVSGCEDAGLDLSALDSITLVDGLVTDNQIGARTTFEPKALLQRVQVSGNRQNFASE